MQVLCNSHRQMQIQCKTALKIELNLEPHKIFLVRLSGEGSLKVLCKNSNREFPYQTGYQVKLFFFKEWGNLTTHRTLEEPFKENSPVWLSQYCTV